ncbi:MAG: hypothetical protein M1823_006199 [Watsoniomyces obsoletus]|nr:MAG: hypothetical protein M1823_006199 [Watsoniomyces obsoletus]
MALDGNLLGWVGGSILAYWITRIVYNLYFHPLARYPGPTLWAAFRTPFVRALVSGVLPFRIKEFHDRYGPIVRVAPDELSFIDPTAWHDIYSSRPGHQPFVRPTVWKNKLPGKDADSLISAPEADHARFRRVLGPAFSEKAIRAQEPLIRSYIDLLIDRLMSQVQDGDGVAITDLVAWFNYTTFDIVGDLGFGEPFGCLRDATYHPWILIILHFKAAIFGVAIKFYPLLAAILARITPKSALKALDDIIATTHDKVHRRLQAKTDRSDFIAYMTRDSDPARLGLNRDEIELNAMTLIVAGSETLTTVLAGTTNALLANPDTLQKLMKEIRTTFSNEDDLSTAASLKDLPYLTAVLQEGMRLCPAIPDGMRRAVPAGGDTVAGNWLPGGTIVSVCQWAAYRSPTNFRDPDRFRPERWLPDGGYDGDRKSAFHPFSMGAHNCLGQTLAWTELRMILARLLWHFDLEVPEPSTSGGPVDWTSQKIYWAWEKVPMKVKLTKRVSP